MYKLIKMIPLIAIALIVYGIIRFDWIAVLLGLILFIVGFVFHVIKRRNVTSGDFFHVYQEIYDLISNIDKTIDNVLIDYPEPKIKLIKGVYYIGIIDCACDSDEKFLKIANAILDDMIFNKNERKHLIQSRTDFDYEVCQILLEGADLFRNVSEGDRAKIRDIPKVVKEFADNKEVSNSINELGQLINTLRVKADSQQ